MFNKQKQRKQSNYTGVGNGNPQEREHSKLKEENNLSGTTA